MKIKLIEPLCINYFNVMFSFFLFFFLFILLIMLYSIMSSILILQGFESEILVSHFILLRLEVKGYCYVLLTFKNNFYLVH